MQDKGKFSKGVFDYVLFEAPQQLMQHVVAHQLRFIVNRGVAEPIAIGAIDITSRSYLYKQLRDWLTLGNSACRVVIPHTALPKRAAQGAANFLNPGKCSPAKTSGWPSCSPAKCSGSCSFDETASPECGVNYFGCGCDNAFIRNLSADIAEQCIDPLMITLNCRTGTMHLKQASNDLQCQDRHEATPELLSRRAI